MLAGGCAVGASIAGSSIFALTAWLALVGMWTDAGITDRVFDYASYVDTAKPNDRVVAANFTAP